MHTVDSAYQASIAAGKRTEFLRGIASSTPSRHIDAHNGRHAILDAAFTKVAHPVNWKNPINVVMTFRESDAVGLGIYLDAIEYFTSTKASVFIVNSEHDAKDKQVNTYRIVSEGYNLSAAGG